MQRTQDFQAVQKDPKHPGRYMYKYDGAKKYVMRWWNGKNWQLNRRKAVTFSPRIGDVWAGAAELHPEVERMMTLGLSGSDKQPVQLPENVLSDELSQRHKYGATA